MRVAIAGAGNVGRSIAAELLDQGHQVLLLERDPVRLEGLSLPGVQRLLADACEVSALAEVRLETCAVVVAATGDDKANLVLSLLAKTEFAVPRVVARVNHPKNEWLFTQAWGVDVAVSQPRLLAALVDEAVGVGHLVRLLRLRDGEAEVVELTLDEGVSVVGRRVGDVAWPPDTALTAVVRDGRVSAPQPQETLRSGDELLLVARPESEDALRTLLTRRPQDGTTGG